MRKIVIEDTPELNEAGRIVARLALDKLKQDGTLGVRQREQLRRAFSTAAEALEWDAIPGEKADRVAAATSDVAQLAAAGARALERDLAELLDDKKAEMEQLEEVHKAVQALAADDGTSYPAEVEYSHTARDGLRRLVTKTETLSLASADEATSAAATLEKRLEGFEKLRKQMLEELKEKQRQIGEMQHGLPAFVEASNRLVVEVLATLA